MFLLPTRLLNEDKYEIPDSLSDCSSVEDIIKEDDGDDAEIIKDEMLLFATNLGYDLDGHMAPADILFPTFSMASHFSPFFIGGEPLEIEMIALWDYFGGNTCFDLNILARETVNVCAEEYPVRATDGNEFMRTPFQMSLGRWITGRPMNPYLGIIPSHYLVTKTFYQENVELFDNKFWFAGNAEIETVYDILTEDCSCLCPGVFVIFSPTWLNPDPQDLRPYFMMVLVEQSSDPSEFCDLLVNDYLEGNVEINPNLLTIKRSVLGHYELFSKRYDTLFDLVYHLANFDSPIGHKLIYNRLNRPFRSCPEVPPPVVRFKRDIRAQPMMIEQWVTLHHDQVTNRIEQDEKIFYVTKSVLDLGKKLHEKIFKKIDLPLSDLDAATEYYKGFKRPVEDTKNHKKSEASGKRRNWSEMPPHETIISFNTPYFINMNRVKFDRVSLGAGAFGSVERAIFEQENEERIPVAVKKLGLSPQTKEERIAAFSELDILMMICHPNIVIFYGFSFDKDSSVMYLIFELMANSFDKFIEKCNGMMSENERCDILAQICRGMGYLHSRTPPVVHGDLAARNILLKPMIAKVTDFGLSKLIRSESYATYNDPNKIPFKWLPPEVLGARILTSKTDVWSFGIICFESYGIGEPYGIMPPTSVYQFIQDGYRFDRLPGMSPCILEIAMECWRKQPVDRPNFVELEDRLLAYIIEDDEEDRHVASERRSHARTKARQEKRNALLKAATEKK
ncbi:unnamed protein product [Caenorhabditis bovis]|uniref:Protein kinase domain-containing protein n=1 Tax=Caenorhabditis bovis TaxID=2654633 RepID=A0A8S1EPD5_9PELO|nr:unnamed protein product [Caenorhabditis bovis]